MYLFAGCIIYTRKTPGALAFLFPEGNASKFGVLVAYIFIVGVSLIIKGAFFATQNLTSFIVNLILGVIIIAIGYIVADGKKAALNKIIWYILVIVFLILVIFMAYGIFGFNLKNSSTMVNTVLFTVGTFSSLFAYLMAFTLLFDPEVKLKFC